MMCQANQIIHPFFFELIYTVISVIICFLIYYKTKESYAITKHNGIKYFRNSFLFFGFSYLSRFLFYIGFFFRNNLSFFFSIFTDEMHRFFFPRHIFSNISLILLTFFSTLAIFYLLLSSIWKKTNNKNYLIVSYVSSVLVSLVILILRKPEVLLFFQLFLIIFSLCLMYYLNKKISKTYTYYSFILFFWLVNIWFLWFLKIWFFLKVIIQILCLILFIIIYKKVSHLLK